MRIAIVAPPWLPVPPPAYGGTEAVLDGLARGLVAAGHEVLLIAHPDSTCPVPKASVVAGRRRRCRWVVRSPSSNTRSAPTPLRRDTTSSATTRSAVRSSLSPCPTCRSWRPTTTRSVAGVRRLYSKRRRSRVAVVAISQSHASTTDVSDRGRDPSRHRRRRLPRGRRRRRVPRRADADVARQGRRPCRSAGARTPASHFASRPRSANRVEQQYFDDSRAAAARRRHRVHRRGRRRRQA